MATTGKKDYIQLVCDSNGKDYNKNKVLMDKAKADLGVTYSEYYKNKLYDMTSTQQAVEARRIIIRRNNRNKRLDKISNATGLTRQEIREKIREINDKNIIDMSIIRYAKYEVFRYEGTELDDFLNLFVKRDLLKEELLQCFEQIDNGLLSYQDIQYKVNEFYQTIEQMMPPSLFVELSEGVLPSYPRLSGNEIERKRIAIDIEATRVLLPFSSEEYIAFHFAEKSIEEKRKFISDKERLKILNEINDPSKFDLLDDKYQAYNILSDHYGRKIIFISSPQDYDDFKMLCKSNGKLVIKPPCDTLGRGIKAISSPKGLKTKKVFKDLLAEYGSFLVEELIHAHDSIRALNPDSVNTVRLITYFDGEKSIVHDTFMKVGQKGSFIDNGGAGGLLVSVDPISGVLNSDGCDENGVVYKQHPYTKVVFNGYQLPDWDKALTLGLEVSNKVPGLSYIGWDITYTSDNEWIIVEGNAKTQFYGQQCAADVGVREDFLKTIGYNK